jgi:hypothetical protein
VCVCVLSLDAVDVQWQGTGRGQTHTHKKKREQMKKTSLLFFIWMCSHVNKVCKQQKIATKHKAVHMPVQIAREKESNNQQDASRGEKENRKGAQSVVAE